MIAFATTTHSLRVGFKECSLIASTVTLIKCLRSSGAGLSPACTALLRVGLTLFHSTSKLSAHVDVGLMGDMSDMGHVLEETTGSGSGDEGLCWGLAGPALHTCE